MDGGHTEFSKELIRRGASLELNGSFPLGQGGQR
jgi:hypothetical protein